jgi:hypothetical protein
MTPEMPPPNPLSSPPSRFWRRALLGLAAIGLVAVVVETTVILKNIGVIDFNLIELLTDSDEAPIRVRNGSLDLRIEGSQQWQQIGGSDNWRIAHARRFKEEFEVTVAVRTGAVCGAVLTATGADIVLVYEKDNDESTTNTARIVLQAAGRRTVVRPDNGVTLAPDSKAPDLLQFAASAGYLKSIAVGSGTNPAVLCTFTRADQLDHLLILNQK